MLFKSLGRADGHSVQIVEFDEYTVEATLKDVAFKDIIESRPEVKDLPTVVLSIGGPTRSGKSFLFNLVVNYMTYLEEVCSNYHIV